MMRLWALAGRIDRRLSWTDTVALIFCCGVPAVLTVYRLIATARANAFAVDFHNYYWASGHDVLHGRSPFPPPIPDSVFLIHTYPAGPYPAPTVLLFAPFGLLPVWLADAIFTGILIAALLFGLWLVGVRDWRCYGAAFLWAPVAFGIQTANLTLLLTLGVAGLWQIRQRIVASALLVGVLVALKFFLWPLVIWLLATRRYVAAASSLVVAAVITVGAWGVLGFSELRDYPRVARIFARYYETSSYTPFALLTKLDIPGPLARSGALSFGVLALAAVLVAARRSRSETASFALAIATCLLWSPIVWIHYFALVLVPLAVLNPAFSLAWLLPAILWVCPVGAPSTAWKFALPLVVCAVALLLASRERSSPRTIAAPLTA